MSLENELNASGDWLFRHRSFIPFLILPLLFYSLLTPFEYSTVNKLLIIGLTLSYIGECIRVYTIAFVPSGTSGRNTKEQIATSLNKKGIYSIVRHPLYFGNFLIYMGPFIYAGNIYGIIIFLLIFWLYYERIMFAEESFLIEKFGNDYTDWSSKTPAFIPNIKLFSPNYSKFSIQRVVYCEYSGICGIIAIFTIIIAFRNYSYNVAPALTDYWKYLFIINMIIYFTLRTLKKYPAINILIKFWNKYGINK